MFDLLVTAALGAECSTVEELRIKLAQIRAEFADPGVGREPPALVRDEAPDIAREAKCLGDAIPKDLADEIHMLLAIQAQLDLEPEVRDEHRCTIGEERVSIAVSWGINASWVTAPCPGAEPVPFLLPELGPHLVSPHLFRGAPWRESPYRPLYGISPTDDQAPRTAPQAPPDPPQ